jgi:hypothetical protein
MPNDRTADQSTQMPMKTASHPLSQEIVGFVYLITRVIG